MQEENNNPEAEQGVIEEEGTSLEGESSTEESTLEDKGDPLDHISDLEALRKEAKKYRGIASRKGSPAPEKESTETQFLTKKDFFRANEKKAINEVRTDAEIDANFDAIKAFYVSRRGQDTPEDIKEDLKDAYFLWKARQAPASDDSASSLATMTVTRPSGSTPKTTVSTDSDPRFQTAARPENWYQK